MSRVRQRILSTELLDSMPDAEAAKNLADLRRINRLTGARAKLVGVLRKHLRPDESFRFLDIGSASGDMGDAVRASFPNATVCSMDLVHRNLAAARGMRLQANVFQLPFPPGSFDVVHCSLFLHHFENAEVVTIIRNMCGMASRLVVIQDLHRHWLSYYFLPLSRGLLRWHPITVNDGMASVAAGWSSEELRNILKKLSNIGKWKLEWHFPSFRYFIAIRMNI